MTDATSAVRPPVVSYELRGPAAWLRLQRPERMNAIDRDVAEGVLAGLDQAQADGARAVVITGTDRVFCANDELAQVLERPDDRSAAAALMDSVAALLRAIERYPAPVIAAVNGTAVAGGFELVLACDLVIAAEDAVLSDGHAKHGLVPAFGSSARLPRIVGATRAKELLFTDRLATAREMWEFGVVTQVVPAGRLEAVTEELCERIARADGAALALIKHIVGEGLDRPLDEALALELEVAKEHLYSAPKPHAPIGG